MTSAWRVRKKRALALNMTHLATFYIPTMLLVCAGEEDALDGLDQEDAENELYSDQNQLPRDHAYCGFCSRDHSSVRWSQLQLVCSQCRATTYLPPAAPIVKRMTVAGHLHFEMHSEGSESGRQTQFAVGEGGVYHVQWRGVDRTDEEMPGENDDWRDPKRVVSRGSVISKKNLVPTKRYQVRACGRGAAHNIPQHPA